MLVFAVGLALTSGHIVPGIKWASLYYGPDQIALAGDVNGDGFGDVIYISRHDQSPITVGVNQSGWKSLVPQEAAHRWGEGLSDACLADIDGEPGKDLVGLFKGNELKVARALKGNRFTTESNWLTLPKTLTNPHLASSGDLLVAWEEGSGEAFQIGIKDKSVKPLKIAQGVRGLAQIFPGKGSWIFTLKSGEVKLGYTLTGTPSSQLGRGAAAVIAEGYVYLAYPDVRAPAFVRALPNATSMWGAADMDHDGDTDLMEFKVANDPHSGHDVYLHRFVTNGEVDSDHDGLTDAEEIQLGTDPYNPDTDGDGLLDGWEVKGFRGLDLKAQGCDPKRFDLVCLVSRFSNTNKEMVERQMKNIQGYYTSLGWSLHPIWLDPVGEEDQKKSWWVLRDKFLPNKWRGVAHWMQLTPWGGGQADQMGDGGGCGGNEWALYATFIHEFGHQLGLPHEGFYNAAWCPTYSSMMNYAYSYTYEGDIKKIHYSDGRLKDFTIRETDLDETIPLPYEKVKFLAGAPYHFNLKPAGDKTLIDWNWNGVFGEKHVRADVNYSYSTTAGRRDEVGKTQCAPWLVVHNKSAYVVYAQHGVKADVKTDPSTSPEKPGWILAKRLLEPYKWSKEVKLVADGCTGDPAVVSAGGDWVLTYPSAKGAEVRWYKTNLDDFKLVGSATLPGDRVPSIGVYKGRVMLWGWSRESHEVSYAWLSEDRKASAWMKLSSAGETVKSVSPVGMTVDTAKNELILGLAEDQDKNRPGRWEIRRYSASGEALQPVTTTPKVAHSEREWIEGEKGGARGSGRPVLLYDAEGRTGMKGRILYYAIGSTSKTSPWACAYVAQSIGDKSHSGGWMVKRYYDEWTQSRSAPGVAWFGDDMIYAYRWVDGSQNDRDNILHVAYRGTGIELEVMGDFDDIGFIHGFGAKHSILYLRE